MCSSGNDSFNNSRWTSRSTSGAQSPILAPAAASQAAMADSTFFAPAAASDAPRSSSDGAYAADRTVAAMAAMGLAGEAAPLMGHHHQQQQPWRHSILPRAVSPQVMPSGHHQLHAPSPQPPSGVRGAGSA